MGGKVVLGWFEYSIFRLPVPCSTAWARQADTELDLKACSTPMQVLSRSMGHIYSFLSRNNFLTLQKSLKRLKILFWHPSLVAKWSPKRNPLLLKNVRWVCGKADLSIRWIEPSTFRSMPVPPCSTAWARQTDTNLDLKAWLYDNL